MITRLGWRHPLQYREPQWGFASRLAALNGRPLDRFLADLDINQGRLFQGDESSIRQLADLAGADHDLLLRYSPRMQSFRNRRNDETMACIAGEMFDRMAISRKSFRYCPQCILSDLNNFEGELSARPWLRVGWTIKYVHVCPTHRQPLQLMEAAGFAGLGYDFNASIARVLPELLNDTKRCSAEHSSPLCDWIIGRLDDVSDNNDFLAEFPLYVVTEFGSALGVSLAKPQGVKAGDMSAEQRAKADDAGFAAVAGGTEGVESALRSIFEAFLKTNGTFGAQSAFGEVYKHLSKTVDDTGYELFRSIVRSFVSENLPLPDGSVVLGQSIGPKKVTSVFQVAKKAGIHPETMLTYLQRHGLIEHIEGEELRVQRIFLKTEDVECALRGIEDSMDSEEAEARFHMPSQHFRTLADDGILRTISATQGQYRANHLIASIEIKEMLDRVFEGAVAVEFPQKSQINIEKARRMTMLTFLEIFKMVHDGELSWKGVFGGGRNWGDLLVDVSEPDSKSRFYPELRASLRMIRNESAI